MQHAPAAVLVVTSQTGEATSGLTVSSFCSVSMDPPTLLICVNHEAYTHQIIADSGRFCASFLSHDQESAAMAFASSSPWEEKIAKSQATIVDCDGLPALDGAIATAACDIIETADIGTHTVYIGEIRHIAHTEGGSPLMYGLQGFGSFSRA